MVGCEKMKTNVTYKGVEMHDCLTRSWEQEAVYDKTHRNVLHIRHRITLEGIEPTCNAEGGNVADSAG